MPAIMSASLIALALVAGVERWRGSWGGEAPISRFQQAEWVAQASAAEDLFRKAMQVLGNAKEAASIAVPNGLTPKDSPFLGDEFTPLVTTLGSLESKRLSAHPGWARALLSKLRNLGIKPGDTVAACFSGSFPALNTALIAACTSLQARLIAISSVTASTYGANQPGFTWPEMEVLFVQSGLFAPVSIAISLGGSKDRGEDLEPATRLQAIRIQEVAARSLGAMVLFPKDLQQAITSRMDLYRFHNRGRLPSLYVNVGGNTASMGESEAILGRHNGFLRPMPFDLSSNRGLIARFTEMGVPVLHLLYIRDLAFRWNIAQ